MKTFVVSLKKSVYRRQRMQKILDDINCDFEFYDAVDGSILANNVLEIENLSPKSKLTKPEIGATLSHIGLWKKMLSENINTALILEDDIHLGESFQKIIDTIDFPSDTLTIFRLETMFASLNIEKTYHQKIGNIQIHKIFSNHAGSAGYIINKKTAKHLLKQTNLLVEAIDTELFDPTRTSLNMPTIYQCIPGVVLQDKCLPQAQQNPELTSVINDNRQDKIDGIIDNQSNLRKKIKNFGRPLYLKLYSLMLYPKNKVRVQIAFEKTKV